ncbi:c-type cytochrome biogenesis protein CcmI [Acerihabitans sp. KWT182]|uniref:C-type cytochrome biogenesis protein CcmI n=1 Tax=Acerihabitans sp. KWT182 TaxID=3157919 RepID=A0AAU7Q7J6_9GAMM
MIALGVTMAFLLALAAGVFVLPALRLGPGSGAMSRDGLNTLFYRRRLDELARDEAEGLIAERARHIEDLQQNLLADIPTARQAPRRRLGNWVLLPGVVTLMAVTLGFYAGTGGYGQLWRWQRQVDELPVLRARLMDPHARQLTPAELSRFAVGLRASLQRQPDNVRDWLMLGRIGAARKDAAMAILAFERAWRLAPDNDDIGLDYATALIRSADAGDNLAGNRLLHQLIQRRPSSIPTLNLLAISEYQQNNFPQAIILWRRLLTLLPADDAHVEIIEHDIDLARKQSGQGGA